MKNDLLQSDVKICLWEFFLDLKCNWNYSRKKVCRSEFNKVKVQILRYRKAGAWWIKS